MNFSPERRAEILAMAKDGWSAWTIARTIGCAPGAVRWFVEQEEERRAAEHIRQMRAQRMKPATRTCLRCRKPFASTHAGNRRCRKCSGSPGFHVEQSVPW